MSNNVHQSPSLRSQPIKRAAVGLVLTLLVLLLLALGNQVLFEFFDHPRIYESHSPAQLGKAVFLQRTGGFQGDMSLSLHVQHRSTRFTFIDMGFVGGSEWSYKFDTASWSKDGTVFVIYYAHPQHHPRFVAAYDFLKQKEISSDERQPKHRSAEIQALMKRRGGIGKPVYSPEDQFYYLSRTPWWWESPG